MINYILIAVLAVILGLPVWYICRAKKQGKACVGCPHAGNCAHKCGK